MEKLRSIFRIDLVLFLCMTTLMIIGVFSIYSCGVSSSGIEFSTQYLRQILWVGLSIGTFFIISNLDFNLFKRLSFIFYFTLLVVSLVPFFSGVQPQHYIKFFGFSFEITGMMTLATILALASFCFENQGRLKELNFFLIAVFITVLPMAIILRQGSLVALLLYIPVFFLITFLSGARKRHIIFAFLFIILLVLLTISSALVRTQDMGSFIFSIILAPDVVLEILVIVGIVSFLGYRVFKSKVLYWLLYCSLLLVVSIAISYILVQLGKPYQLNFLVSFFNQNATPSFETQTINQYFGFKSLGNFEGQGYLKGYVTHSGFIPSMSSEFIFTSIVEEWGSRGGLVVIILYSIILYRSFMIQSRANDRFAVLVVGGLITVFLTSLIVSICLLLGIGIFPTIGTPLYFLSYGGSALLTGAITLGLISNLHHKRNKT